MQKILKSKYVQASSLYLALSLLPSLINFLLLPFYLGYISPTEFGQLTLLNAYAILFTVFSCLQLNVAASTQYFSQNINKVEYTIVIVSASAIITMIIFTIFTLFGSTFFSIYESNIQFYPLGFLVLLTAALGQLYISLFTILKNEYQLKQIATSSILILLINVSSQLLLITKFKYGLDGIVYGQLVSKILVVPVILYYFKNQFLGTKQMHALKKNYYPMLKNALIFSLPILPTVLLAQLQKVGDRFILERHISLEELGQYSILMLLIGLPSLAINAIFNSLRPKILILIEEQNLKAVNQAEFFYTIGIIFIFILSCLLGTHLELFTDNSKYIAIKKYLYLGVLGSLPGSMLYFNHLKLMQKGRTKPIARYSFYSFLIQILCLFLLVPQFGIEGALYALLISGLYNYLLNSYGANKESYLAYLGKQRPFLAFVILSILAIASVKIEIDISYSSIVFFIFSVTLLIFLIRKNIHTLKQLYHLF